jgi:hypothetical protein
MELAIFGASVSPAFAMTIVACVQSSPNAAGGAVTGPFDGEASVHRLETPSRVRSQAIGFAGYGAYP